MSCESVEIVREGDKTGQSILLMVWNPEKLSFQNIKIGVRVMK